VLTRINKGKNKMTTITENTTIEKKAPAKKESLLDVIGAEAPTEATRVTKVDELEESLKSYKIRLDSMYKKNESLQSKLDIINTDCAQIVMPQRYLEKLINERVEKSSDDLIERVNEAEKMLEKLHSDDIQEALKDLLQLKDLKERLKDVEYDLEDKFARVDVENEIDNALDYKDYCTSDDIDEMINDKINPDDYITTGEHNDEYRTLEDKISILENKQRHYNKGLLSKLYALIKRLFGYNFKSKVGV
jgi:hypothetical protein